jgi:hypothetical protein
MARKAQGVPWRPGEGGRRHGSYWIIAPPGQYYRPVLNRLSRRAAPLLLGLFLAGGSASSLLDAFLYHGRTSEGRSRIHFDAAGGCGAHLEHCVLTRTAAETRLLPSVPPSLAWAAQTVTGAASGGTGRFGSIELHTLSHPRAPPVV